ncbi:benenodin family lasso peptide [Sphingomonas sp. H39-1-10]|nr:benenodin family lasso peptide [Sphingomonas pollutisoli]MDF0490256.1 benenodin family lasso peptide [Sphingomonas pollutisoli]
MQRNEEKRDDSLIDLGAVVEETKGPDGNREDIAGGMRQQLGLSDD